jgi:hypothetical protein
MLHAMFISKLVAAVGITLGILTFGAGTGMLVHAQLQSPAPERQAALVPTPSQPPPRSGLSRESMPTDPYGVIYLPPVKSATGVPPPVRQEPPKNDLAARSDEDVQSILAARKTITKKMGVLLEVRYQTARTAADYRWKEFLEGRGTQNFLFDSLRVLLDSDRELNPAPAHQTEALEKHLHRTRLIEQVDKKRYDAGRISVADYSEAKLQRLEAEILLEQTKSK